MREITGQLSGKGVKVALVAARFNEAVVGHLVDGARRSLLQHGVQEGDIVLVWVPGAMELPVAVSEIMERGAVDAIVALGAVIRGQTPHFDFVAGGAATGIAQEALRQRIPVSFGVLTTDSWEQATDRAGGKMGNKGADAADTALEMVSVLRQLRAQMPPA